MVRWNPLEQKSNTPGEKDESLVLKLDSIPGLKQQQLEEKSSRLSVSYALETKTQNR